MSKRALLSFIACLVLVSLTCKLGGQSNDPSPTPGDNLPQPPTPVTSQGEATPVDPAQAPPTPGGSQAEPPASEPASQPASSGPEIPFEEREAALDDLITFLNDLPAENQASDNQAMVDYLLSRPEFVAADVSSDGTVWGEFSDGRLLFIFNNRTLDAGNTQSSARPPGRGISSKHAPLTLAAPPTLLTAASVPAPAATAKGELPQSDRAYLLSAMGTWWPDATPDLEKWVGDSGYDVVNSAPTVEMLKGVSGSGMFYLDTHGGKINDFHGKEVYGLWTATPIDSFNESLLRLDIEAGRVAYAAAKHDEFNGKPLYARHYAITADFVTEYMSFAPNSFVFINACSSNMEEMRKAFLAQGASVYAGWSITVDGNFADRTARFLFDRLLGTNKGPEPETPKQRPFDYIAVKGNMGERNLLTDPGGSKLTFTQGSGDFALLMPSIAYMEVEEDSDELFILGMFGSEKGTVTIGGQSADVRNWEQELVVVHLADTGPGSAGDVVVKVRDHESNAVPLTEWRGEIRYSTTADSLAPNLNSYIVMKVHFRADVHPYREEPGHDPVEREVTFVLAGDSSATWKMEGSATRDGTTFEISGSGSLPLDSKEHNHDNAVFGMSGTLKPQGMLAGNPPVIENVDFHIHLSSNPNTESRLKVVVPGYGTEESGFPIMPTDALFDQVIELDTQFNILPDKREATTMFGVPTLGLGTLEWDLLEASNAPKLGDLPHAAAPMRIRPV
ncbi:MAG: hypothetical protein ACE5E7_18725 [Anaerolineae bacterium]